MHKEYVNLISELDKIIEGVRQLWIEAKEQSPDKNKWRVRIDELLDERMRLMRARDAAEEIDK